MKNKLFLGLALVLLGLYQIFGKYINLEAFQSILNYQFILILVGLYLLIKNKGQSIAGIFLIAFGVYSYLKDFVNPAYLDTITSFIIIIAGGSLIYLSFKEKKK